MAACFRITAASLMSLLFPVLALAQTTPSRDYEDADAYEVYATVIPGDWLVSAHAKTLVIEHETSAYPLCLEPDKASQSKIGPALDDYRKKAETTWLLQPVLSLETPYVYVPREEVNNYFDPGRGGWEGFHKIYPESLGYLMLSAVGFNPDKTVAVVYEGHSCGNQCGGGAFHVLEKKDGKWVPVKWTGTSCGWAS